MGGAPTLRPSDCGYPTGLALGHGWAQDKLFSRWPLSSRGRRLGPSRLRPGRACTALPRPRPPPFPCHAGSPPCPLSGPPVLSHPSREQGSSCPFVLGLAHSQAVVVQRQLEGAWPGPCCPRSQESRPHPWPTWPALPGALCRLQGSPRAEEAAPAPCMHLRALHAPAVSLLLQ